MRMDEPNPHVTNPKMLAELGEKIYKEQYQHDYEQLEIIYAHTDSYDSYQTDGGGGGGGGGGCNAPPGRGCNKGETGNGIDNGWGISLGRRGQQETFLRIDPDGTRHITFVTWVRGH